MKKVILIIFCSLFTVNCSLAQQVIYVNISNNTGIENGTTEHPFNTILEGLAASQNGYSVSIATGNYAEDTLLIEKCISVAGNGRESTTVNGTFVLSSKLDTLPVLIRNLWCENVLHSDSGFTRTPLTIMDCGLRTLNDYTSYIGETGRIILKNCEVADSIHIESASCAARREVINCETEGGLWVSCISSQGTIRIADNLVNGCLRVSTVSKDDTVFITGNHVKDSLLLLSVASDSDVISNNTVGRGIRIHAVAHSGFLLMDNLVQNGSLTVSYTALSESEIKNNTFLNGGIDFKAVSGDITIKGNEIHADETMAGIRLKTTAGGFLENNTITLPYSEPSGLPFEEDTGSVCGINVQSVAFGGMKRNKVTGGAYGVYLRAIASNNIDQNEIEDSHYGLYLSVISARVDSNRVEQCLDDGMILDYPSEDADTNSIRVNHNIVRNNGGHGIWTKGNVVMGNLKDPGTGFNIVKNNGGYDLYVETPYTFVDTIWAQNNEWTHSTEEEVGQLDIYDAADDPAKALAMYKPSAPHGTGEYLAQNFVLYPNPTTAKFKVQSAKFKVEFQSLELMDLCGNVLELMDPGILELDISQFPSGIYFIRIKSVNQTIVKKIIKL